MQSIYRIISIICLTISGSMALSQNNNELTAGLESRLDSLIQSTMENEHIPGVAFIIVKDGKTLLKKGYGYTSLGEEIARVDPDRTVFRIGSITKTFTATALLQLVDNNQVNLDVPINKYLNSFKVKSTFKKSITPAHLINHSAGFDELRGRVVYDSTQSIPLSEFLKERLVPLREPGLISSYSSYGIALAGLMVEEVTGMGLEAYMQKHIWEPLEMKNTSMKLTEAIEEQVSWGYEYRNGINVPMPWEYYHTYPASDINSTVADMGNYLLMHLNNGTFKEKTVLSTESAYKMKHPSLRVHPKVEAFAYGFYEEDAQGFRTISHGGDMLGYASYLAMVPEENLGIFVIHHHEGTRLRYQVLDAILSFYAKSTPSNNVDYRKNTTDLSRFAGSYIWTTHCHSCETGWKPDLEKLVVNSDGTFTIMNRTYVQVEDLLFKSTDGQRTIGFVENAKGEITYLSFGASNMFEKVD